MSSCRQSLTSCLHLRKTPRSPSFHHEILCCWVRFTSPPEYVGKTIQLYPKASKLKRARQCGADFSLLRAINHSHPQATTLHDLGIDSSSSAALTSTLLRHFSSTQKLRESTTSSFDDNDTSDDMNIDLQLDFPRPPVSVVFCGVSKHHVRRKRSIHHRASPKAV